MPRWLGNPKSEARSPKQISIRQKKAMTETEGPPVSVILPDSGFEFVSDFGFRVSDLESMMAVVLGMGLDRRLQLDFRGRPAEDALEPAAEQRQEHDQRRCRQLPPEIGYLE